MVELVLVVCLLAKPEVCENRQVPFLRPMGLRSCMHQGQFRIVEWLSENPEWSIKRWRCGMPEA